MTETFYLQSQGIGKLHCRAWKTQEPPKAIVQIVHGLAEHIGRYDHFANWLNARGIMVVAEDHMGHGGSIGEQGIQGYFHGGWDAVAEDVYSLMEHTMQANPGVPYILFGHSMGSLLARTLLAKHPDSGIAGAVICGTLWRSQEMIKTVLPVVKAMCLGGRDTQPGHAVQKLMFGSNNQRVEHKRTPSDWLTRDNRIVDEYETDPLCGFTATVGLYRDILQASVYLQQKDTLAAMNPKTPVFFVAGGDDPVGNYGKGVEQAANAFREAGVEQVKLKIYPLCRHEILNELNRESIYQDIFNWIQGCLPPRA